MISEMHKEIIKNKTKLIVSIRAEIQILFEKIQLIFSPDNLRIKSIANGIIVLDAKLSDLESIPQTSMADLLKLYDSNWQLMRCLSLIHKQFDTILDKQAAIDTFLSQTYVNETREYNERISILFAKFFATSAKIDEKIDEFITTAIYDDFIKTLPDESAAIEKFKTIIELAHKMPAVYQILAPLTNSILTYLDTNKLQQISYHVMDIIEDAKSIILKSFYTNNKESVKTLNNPSLKSFHMVPISRQLNISEIFAFAFLKNKHSNTGATEIVQVIQEKPAEIAQKTESKPIQEKPAEIATLTALTKYCKTHGYDLLVMNKYSQAGINYDIFPLIDFDESKDFQSATGAADGINLSYVKRYNTINYINTDAIQKWHISYDYIINNKENAYILILESLYPDTYKIISNYFNINRPFVKKDNILHFIEYAESFGTSKQNVSRLNNYNDIINDSIVANMFLPFKPDLTKLKVKSQIMDPKYMRNSIHIKILDKYNELYDKSKKMTMIYDFNVIVHCAEFEEIFSRVIMNEYFIYAGKYESLYETENVPFSEIYASFIYTANLYERDFRKKINDTMIARKISRDIFALPAAEKKKVLFDIFVDILREVLGTIITNESNLFQSLIYKLYLYKLSILD